MGYEPHYHISKSIFPSNPPIIIDIPKENIKNNKNLSFNNSQNSMYSDSIKCSNKNNYLKSKFPALLAEYSEGELQLRPLICGSFHIKEAKICKNKLTIDKKIDIKEISIYESININIPDFKKNEERFYLSNCNMNKNKITYSYNAVNRSDDIGIFNPIEVDVNPLLGKQIPSFIKTMEQGKFIVPKGDWYIKKPIVIEGDLTIEGDSTLKFSPNSYLIINGGLRVDGTKNKPVNLSSIETNGYWKGLYVYNETRHKSKSIVRNLNVSNIEAMKDGILNLTGGITFYNSDLDINNLKITNSSAEDALNIVNSNIRLIDLEINNSVSDAFDCDFCEGSIKYLTFNNIGGDGLDLSGSKVEANVSSAKNIKDKVVSVGEESDAKISISGVRNSYLAAAVKDGSIAAIKLNDVQTNGPLVMTYTKKDFYTRQTKATINASQYGLKDIPKKFISSKETILIVNGIKVKDSNIDVQRLYEIGPMKK